MHPKYFLAALIGIYGSAIADDQSASASTGGFLQVLMILVLVLGLMMAAAWALKKFNASGAITGSTIKIIGGVAVGSRERIMVVEVADQWIVVGVTTTSINALATMPKQDITPSATDQVPLGGFAGRLKQFIENRNAK